MVGMAVGDDGAHGRAHRIDEEVARFDIEALRQNLDPGLRQGNRSGNRGRDCHACYMGDVGQKSQTLYSTASCGATRFKCILIFGSIWCRREANPMERTVACI